MNGQSNARGPNTNAAKQPMRTAPPVYQPNPAREVLQAKMMFLGRAPNGAPAPVQLKTAGLRPPDIFRSTIQRAQTATSAGNELLSANQSLTQDTSTKKWSRGILIWQEEDTEGEVQNQSDTFDAYSGTYTGTKQSCQNKDGYRNGRAGKQKINHNCGEAHVLNWADGILTARNPQNRKKPSRLILLSQETLCKACEQDLVAFSTNHPKTYVQVRSKDVYDHSRLPEMASTTGLSRNKDGGYRAYRPMVGGQYIAKRNVGTVRNLKIDV